MEFNNNNSFDNNFLHEKIAIKTVDDPAEFNYENYLPRSDFSSAPESFVGDVLSMNWLPAGRPSSRQYGYYTQNISEFRPHNDESFADKQLNIEESREPDEVNVMKPDSGAIRKVFVEPAKKIKRDKAADFLDVNQKLKEKVSNLKYFKNMGICECKICIFNKYGRDGLEQHILEDQHAN